MISPNRRLVLLYGGRSTEQEISCRSASMVLKNIDLEHNELFIIGINPDGEWYFQNNKDCLKQAHAGPLEIDQRQAAVDLELLDDAQKAVIKRLFFRRRRDLDRSHPIVVFPMLHGTNGEDGSIQGLLALADVAFVGADHVGSAIGMDKGLSKRLAAAAGVQVAAFVELQMEKWSAAKKEVLEEIWKLLKLPIFVKPARLGSSVGIEKVTDKAKLESEIENAFEYDDKLIIEQGVDAREIECAAIGGWDCELTTAGEIETNVEFYTYEAKYLSTGASTVQIPADLSDQQLKTVQKISSKVYQALELGGMSRIDLFLDRQTGDFYFNEVNTIPGFTSVSQYPQLWAHQGLPPKELIEKLIEHGQKRHATRQQLRRGR